MGFTIGLHRHHDHGIEAGYEKRFGIRIICCDCNAADGAVKRKFQLPKHWSFAPKEIAQFVQAKPHTGKTVIDYDKALSIFKAANA
jgi:hypothetical protein